MMDVHHGTPLVSVLIVSYNQEEFIREALVSALEQNYENLQVVISDDASMDSTQHIILEVAKDNPADRLKVILNPQNLGITGNCNKALRHCNGELVAFMGGDDVLLRGKIAQQVAWFNEHPDMVLCGHAVELIDENGEQISSKFGELGEFRAGRGAGGIIRSGTPFSAVSVMVKHDRIPSYGFHPSIPMVSDWKLWIDVVGSDGAYGFIEGKWAQYRRHSGNVTVRMNWKIAHDILLTALLSLWHLRGRFALLWLCYFGRMLKARP